jgi:hypothetical protein
MIDQGWVPGIFAEATVAFTLSTMVAMVRGMMVVLQGDPQEFAFESRIKQPATNPALGW